MKTITILVYTLGGIFMEGFFVAAKINGGDKYGGFTEKPPHYPRHLYAGR